MTAGETRFVGAFRLHKPAEFAAVFSNRRVLKGEWFYLHYGPIVANARLGLVIPKKHARHAVARNLLKRIGREAFRHARSRLPRRELIVRLVRSVNVGKEDSGERRLGWRAEIDALLLRLPQ
jgi:ribonuclease P protein component